MKEEHIEFLVEEPSMRNFLQGILPRILPEGYQLDVNCFIREHQGKQDLKKSIPKKVKAFQYYSIPVKVVVIHDQDSSDCRQLKSELEKLITDNSNIPFLIRIACRELEAWYLGDMDALNAVYPGFNANSNRGKALFRNPDECNPSDEIRKRIPTFQKGYASKEIAQYFVLEKNRSTSFNQLVSGIRRFLANKG